MNWRGLALTIALALQQSEPQRFPVEGIVQDAQTGAPISGAQLRLSGTLPGDTRPTTVSGLSGQDGSFRLLAQPAEYTLSAQREGYFGQKVYGAWQAAASQRIEVKAGQAAPASTFRLTGTGVITGQIADQNGRPASRVSVAAMQLRYAEGRPTVVSVNSGTTNERGEYRLFWVPPGEYLVAFSPPLSFVVAPQTIPTGNTQSIQAATFYPGTADRSKARVVSVTSGGEVRNVDIAIQTLPVFTISGRIDYPFPPVSPNAASAVTVLPTISMLSHESLLQNPINMGNTNGLPIPSRQVGLFEFRAIASGTYDLIATVPAMNGQPMQSGQITINVGFQDLKDIAIPVQPLFTFQGRIVAQGIRLPANTILRLLLTGRTSLPIEVTMGANGEFQFNNLSAGAYRLDVVLPDDTYVADLRSNVFQLPTQANEPLALSVRSNAGRITGVATNADGKIGTDTTVVLVPDEAFRQNSMLFRTARPDETGKFTLTRIAPGSYKLFAWEGVQNTAWLNPEFLGRNESDGIAVTVGAGTTSDVKAAAGAPR